VIENEIIGRMPWDQWKADTINTPTVRLSEVRGWVSRLPFRMQGTIFAAVRGGDLVSKPLVVRHTHRFGNTTCHANLECDYSHTDDAPERQLTQWLRYLTLRPYDEREVDHPGAYMQSKPPHAGAWKPSMFGAHPMHWYMHLAHAYEVVGYEYPDDDDHLSLKVEAFEVYHRLVTSLHLPTESREHLWERMTEDRIATQNIVS
jgi:hypothetical protein